jgi:hypothetical protein
MQGDGDPGSTDEDASVSTPQLDGGAGSSNGGAPNNTAGTSNMDDMDAGPDAEAVATEDLGTEWAALPDCNRNGTVRASSQYLYVHCVNSDGTSTPTGTDYFYRLDLPPTPGATATLVYEASFEPTQAPYYRGLIGAADDGFVYVEDIGFTEADVNFMPDGSMTPTYLGTGTDDGLEMAFSMVGSYVFAPYYSSPIDYGIQALAVPGGSTVTSTGLTRPFGNYSHYTQGATDGSSFYIAGSGISGSALFSFDQFGTFSTISTTIAARIQAGYPMGYVGGQLITAVSDVNDDSLFTLVSLDPTTGALATLRDLPNWFTLAAVESDYIYGWTHDAMPGHILQRLPHTGTEVTVLGRAVLNEQGSDKITNFAVIDDQLVFSVLGSDGITLRFLDR